MVTSIPLPAFGLQLMGRIYPKLSRFVTTIKEPLIHYKLKDFAKWQEASRNNREQALVFCSTSNRSLPERSSFGMLLLVALLVLL